jgi:hypothetical protein
MMGRPGAARSQLAEVLTAAYGAGLLSERTLTYRLDLLFSRRLVQPPALVGDLTQRMPTRWLASIQRALAAALHSPRIEAGPERSEPLTLLALDWGGAQDELVVGRQSSCDIVLNGPYVSRRHARLVFRDGNWIIQDLTSTNGTEVNGVTVGRLKLCPGDELAIGTHRLMID